MTIKEIFEKYRDHFDSISNVWDVADHLNHLFETGGDEAVEAWFRPAATEEYKSDLKALIVRE